MAKKFIALKKEILGIEDIKETTKALEKISAASLHYLKMTNQRIENYEKILKQIFIELLEEFPENRLFQRHLKGKKLNVILTTEKGLSGGLLNNLLNFLKENIKEEEDVLVVGKEGRKKAEEKGIKISYFYPGFKEIPKDQNIRGLEDFIVSKFLNSEYREIIIFWPNFKNFGYQVPKKTTFLPIDKEKIKIELGEKSDFDFAYPIYEPGQKKIINYLIKEYLNLVFYQKILETKLSELSARTLAMENSSNKASNLIRSLNWRYFREKREVVTKEITDLFSHRKSIL